MASSDKVLPWETAKDMLAKVFPLPEPIELPILRKQWIAPTKEGRYRLLEGAVEEANYCPRDICNQGCKRHIYLLPGEVREQLTPDPLDKRRGEIHDCLMKRVHMAWKGYFNEIQISLVRQGLNQIRNAPASEIHIAIESFENLLKKQERYNLPWGIVFQTKYKKHGLKAIPKSKDVEKILDE